MEAVEFIKKYGIDEAKRVLVYCEEQGIGLCVGSKTVSISELNRFIESYKYIEKFGGIDKAKTLRGLACFLTVSEYKKHNQAIEDMEKLYEKEH